MFEALDFLGIDRPKDSEETYKTHLRIADIEAQVAGLIIKWDVYNSLSRIIRLKVDHSNLDEWIENLRVRLFPLWLRRVVTGPSKFGTLVPSFGEDVKPEDRPIYWYYIYKAISAAICTETVEPGALTATQQKMGFDVLVKTLKMRSKRTRRKEIFERILRHPLYIDDPDPKVVMMKFTESLRWLMANHSDDEPFISRLIPVYQRYIETYGQISSMGKLRSKIERFLIEENGDKPDLLEFIDQWMTDANTFIDDKVPTGGKTALISVLGARSSMPSSSSTKQIIKAFAPFLNEKTGRYTLDIPRKTLSSLFDGRCVKCGFIWSKNHRCSNMTFLKKGLDKNSI